MLKTFLKPAKYYRNILDNAIYTIMQVKKGEKLRLSKLLSYS